MYPLLPVHVSVLMDLPVELWCIVLKYLNAKDLLNAARSLPRLYEIVLGDSTLRRTYEEAVHKEHERLTRPGSAVTISRNDYSRIFDGNCLKKVALAKCPKIFEVVYGNNQEKSSGGKIRKIKVSKASRFKPYRL